MTRYYDGIVAFKGYMNRIFGRNFHPYDWADLSPKERELYAEREKTPRERRAAKREKTKS